jgi:hemoglobin-like flavoprotein
MTEKQVLIVKHSWSYVANQLDDTNALFCKNLLRLLPDIKPILEKRKQEKGAIEIMGTVNRIVATLPDFSKVETEIRMMQKEFENLGITRSGYDSALSAFLMTLEKKTSKIWSLETRDSWVFVFASITQHIRKLNLKFIL